MDKREAPLLTAEMANEIMRDDPRRSGRIPTDACDALEAIESGDAAVYNTHTHEVAPKGMREAVEAVIAVIDGQRLRGGGETLRELESMYEQWTDDLRRALNGEKANG